MLSQKWKHERTNERMFKTWFSFYHVFFHISAFVCMYRWWALLSLTLFGCIHDLLCLHVSAFLSWIVVRRENNQRNRKRREINGNAKIVFSWNCFLSLYLCVCLCNVYVFTCSGSIKIKEKGAYRENKQNNNDNVETLNTKCCYTLLQPFKLFFHRDWLSVWETEFTWFIK